MCNVYRKCVWQNNLGGPPINYILIWYKIIHCLLIYYRTLIGHTTLNCLLITVFQAEKGASGTRRWGRGDAQLQPGRWLAGPTLSVPARAPWLTCEFAQVFACQWCQWHLRAGHHVAQPATALADWHASQRRGGDGRSACQVGAVIT